MLVKPKLNNCPRCYGRIIIDRHNPGEASCINCGHVAYIPDTHLKRKFQLSSVVESNSTSELHIRYGFKSDIQHFRG